MQYPNKSPAESWLQNVGLAFSADTPEVRPDPRGIENGYLKVCLGCLPTHVGLMKSTEGQKRGVRDGASKTEGRLRPAPWTDVMEGALHHGVDDE